MYGITIPAIKLFIVENLNLITLYYIEQVQLVHTYVQIVINTYIHTYIGKYYKVGETPC